MCSRCIRASSGRDFLLEGATLSTVCQAALMCVCVCVGPERLPVGSAVPRRPALRHPVRRGGRLPHWAERVQRHRGAEALHAGRWENFTCVDVYRLRQSANNIKTTCVLSLGRCSRKWHHVRVALSAKRRLCERRCAIFPVYLIKLDKRFSPGKLASDAVCWIREKSWATTWERKEKVTDKREKSTPPESTLWISSSDFDPF